MKELIEKLTLLEVEFKDKEIHVEHLFEAPNDENINNETSSINAQAIKIISDKINVKPEDLRLTLSRLFKNQNVSSKGRQHVTAMLALLFKQQLAFLNRMK